MQPARMRKPRHRWIQVSVFFIAYSVFHAILSSQSVSGEAEEKETTVSHLHFREAVRKEAREHDEKIVHDINTSPKTPETEEENKEVTEPKEREEETTESGKKAQKGVEEEDEKVREVKEETEGSKKVQKDAGFKWNKTEEETLEKEIMKEKSAIPTVHPLRDNCTPPAIEQFPRPLMGQNARKHGGLIIHVLVAMFTFIGLAIVCDEYFVSSLDRICEEFKLAPDVAGATFMAAGSSAPELATVIIGVFCAQDDIGISGVIGSAVFNIMFVISVCALCAGTVSHLNWWPLCRDCFFYAISILVMLCTICNGYVSWPEALFMLLMYVVYCIALRFNSQLERWAMTIPLPFKLPTREEQAALVTYRSNPKPAAPGVDGEYTQVEGQTKAAPAPQQPAQYNPDGTYDNVAYNADPLQPNWGDPNAVWDPNQSWDDTNAPVAPAPTAPAMGGWGGAADSWGAQQHQQQERRDSSPTSLTSPQQTQEQPPAPKVPAQPAYYKAKEYNPETAIDHLVKPVGANPLQLAWWYIAFPVHWSCRHTMPDCRGRWYPVTFFMSMLWISFYSYFMVWMITIIGYTLGIPDTVMGLTFVAAGVSVPDALSSLAVIKEGYGDMAVSNAVGSNVFDILVCLGLPWFLQTAIIHPGSHVNVISKGLIYSTLSLFSTVIFLVVATHANGWKLDRKYGVVLMVWYILFITFASLYELNIFGNYHPPDCISTY